MRIAGDGMSASLDVGAGEPLARDDVLQALVRAGVVFGVDEAACDLAAELAADAEGRVEDLQIARGAAPVVGEDGYFAPAFEPGIQPGHIDTDGKMDFRNRELLKPVAAAAPLGFLHAAIAGVPGKRVDGGTLAVPAVREAALVLGPGVQRMPEGKLFAAVAGVILYVPGKQLDVVREHKHRGDVDLRSGHLDMAGSLSVSGDVQRQFHVRATGDVQVLGAIRGGSAIAGGSLVVKGVVQGPEGELRAGGDVQLRSAESAHVHSGGLLKLESAVHCALSAKVIEVGVLRGGTAQAERFVLAREAGSSHRVETAIQAGIPLELAHEELRAAVASARDDRSLQRARGGRAETGRGGKDGRGRPSLQRDELQRLLSLREQREQLQRTAHVVVQSIAHPGVTIQLGDARLTLDQSVASSRFFYDASRGAICIERFVP